MRNDERAGLLFALAGFALLSCGDAVIKSMAGMWSPTAMAALRYAFGAIGLATIVAAREGRGGFAFVAPRAQLLRATGICLSSVGFFSAVMLMPLADATSISFTSPMITALLAALFGSEPARRDTQFASGIAFAGVLVVLRPNFAALGLSALLPLMAALGTSLLIIGNRAAAGKASAMSMQLILAACAVPLLLLVSWAGDLSGIPRLAVHVPHWSVIARCALLACSASVAHYLIYLGTTRAGAATVAPMTYVQLVVALVLGWVFYGEAPDLVALSGAAVIILAGLYLWHAGRVREPGMTD